MVITHLIREEDIPKPDVITNILRTTYEAMGPSQCISCGIVTSDLGIGTPHEQSFFPEKEGSIPEGMKRLAIYYICPKCVHIIKNGEIDKLLLRYFN